MKEKIEAAKLYQYNSLQFIEDEDIADAIVFKESIGFLLVYKVSKESIMIHWAAESKEKFLDEMKDFVTYAASAFSPYKNLQTSFIPRSFVRELYEIGFRITSEWTDFWKYDLTAPSLRLEKTSHIRPINLVEEYSIAGGITRSCSGSSRGFKGESDEWVLEWGKSENSNVFVFKENHSLIGVCFVRLYGFDSEKGIALWIRELAVTPSHQAKGIGKALLQYSLDWGRANGAVRSFLACDSENKNAIHLYESFGYVGDKEQSEIAMSFEWVKS